GFRLALAAGWYEVPSHVDADELRRLLDLLADGLSGVEDIVEGEWGELDTLELGPGTLACVTIPGSVGRAESGARLHPPAVRRGRARRARAWAGHAALRDDPGERRAGGDRRAAASARGADGHLSACRRRALAGGGVG